MGNTAKQTEHSGPKQGQGSYDGLKAHAKRESNKLRRRLDGLAAATPSFPADDPAAPGVTRQSRTSGSGLLRDPRGTFSIR